MLQELIQVVDGPDEMHDPEGCHQAAKERVQKQIPQSFEGNLHDGPIPGGPPGHQKEHCAGFDAVDDEEDSTEKIEPHERPDSSPNRRRPRGSDSHRLAWTGQAGPNRRPGPTLQPTIGRALERVPCRSRIWVRGMATGIRQSWIDRFPVSQVSRIESCRRSSDLTDPVFAGALSYGCPETSLWSPAIRTTSCECPVDMALRVGCELDGLVARASDPIAAPADESVACR